jgi:hypothetical protein
VSDAKANRGYAMTLRRCALDSVEGSPACVALAGKGALDMLDCSLANSDGAALEMGKQATARLWRCTLRGAPAILLRGGVPELVGCGLGTPAGKAPIAAAEGTESGSVRLLNSVLSAEPAGTVKLLPAKSLPGGNLVVAE